MDTNKKQILLFIAICYFISWFFWLGGYLIDGSKIPMIFLVLGTFGPTITAIILEKRQKTSSLIKLLINFKSSYKAYLISLFFIPILIVLVLVIGEYPYPELNKIPILGLIIAFVMNMIFGGALGEEIGWRGFLLPNLNRIYNDFISNFLTGIIWGVWHMPLFLTKTYENPVIQYFIIVLLLSFLFSFVFKLSKKSLWPVIILHGIFNFSNQLLGGLFPQTDGILQKDWWLFISILLIIVIGVCITNFSSKEKKIV